MKSVIRIAILIFTMLFVIAGQAMGEDASRSDDFMYQMIYSMVEQDLQAKGYTDYEIIIDDNYNVTVNLKEPASTATPAPEEPVQEAQESAAPAAEKEPEAILGSEEEYALGIQELEQENIVEAMQHFLRALPNEEAEKMIAENAADYVDELMFAEEYETAQKFMMEHPFDDSEQLLAECNNYCFIEDLSKGLNERWKISDQDTTTMSDSDARKWYQQMVECETQHLDKYTELGFSDPEIADYAYAYIGAVQSQMTGAAYYGIDNEKYNEYWTDHGINVRSRMIYLLNRKYGLKIDSAYKRTFADMIKQGKGQDFLIEVTRSITEELSSVEVPFKMESIGPSLYIQPFKLKNTSGYDISNGTGYLEIYPVFLDNRGNELFRLESGLFVGQARDGEDFVWNSNLLQSHYSYIKQSFDSICFECTLYDYSYGDMHRFTVTPYNQVSWNGTDLVRNGEEKKLVTSFALEEVKAYWTVKRSYFVPSVECILRNNGTADLKEAVIQCVFIDKDKNTEWSREKYYAISSSDVPLASGRGRNVIIYSTMGYEKKTRKVPDLEAEIYVNGQAVTKIDVTKP